jgi:hypothetical protein
MGLGHTLYKEGLEPVPRGGICVASAARIIAWAPLRGRYAWPRKSTAVPRLLTPTTRHASSEPSLVSHEPRVTLAGVRIPSSRVRIAASRTREAPPAAGNAADPTDIVTAPISMASAVTGITTEPVRDASSPRCIVSPPARQPTGVPHYATAPTGERIALRSRAQVSV